MNDFAKFHSGDHVFKRVMTTMVFFGVVFAIYVFTY